MLQNILGLKCVRGKTISYFSKRDTLLALNKHHSAVLFVYNMLFMLIYVELTCFTNFIPTLHFILFPFRRVGCYWIQTYYHTVRWQMKPPYPLQTFAWSWQHKWKHWVKHLSIVFELVFWIHTIMLIFLEARMNVPCHTRSFLLLRVWFMQELLVPGVHLSLSSRQWFPVLTTGRINHQPLLFTLPCWMDYRPQHCLTSTKHKHS